MCRGKCLPTEDQSAPSNALLGSSSPARHGIFPLRIMLAVSLITGAVALENKACLLPWSRTSITEACGFF